jgi:hypothetical protein
VVGGLEVGEEAAPGEPLKVVLADVLEKWEDRYQICAM